VPQGTRVIGQYDNNVQSGQRRVLLLWNRLIFPNGRSIVLERQPGADADATPACRTVSTITGGISRRLRVFPRSSALTRSLRLTMMIVRFVLSATTAKTRSTMLAKQIVRRQLNVPPTVTVRAGFPVRMIVKRDLALGPYGAS